MEGVRDRHFFLPFPNSSTNESCALLNMSSFLGHFGSVVCMKPTPPPLSLPVPQLKLPALRSHEGHTVISTFRAVIRLTSLGVLFQSAIIRGFFVAAGTAGLCHSLKRRRYVVAVTRAQSSLERPEKTKMWPALLDLHYLSRPCLSLERHLARCWAYTMWKNLYNYKQIYM